MRTCRRHVVDSRVRLDSLLLGFTCTCNETLDRRSLSTSMRDDLRYASLTRLCNVYRNIPREYSILNVASYIVIYYIRYEWLAFIFSIMIFILSFN